MIRKLVGRHGLSEANNRDNYGTPAFDNADAPLMPKGREQAAQMGELFIVEHKIIPANTPVAVSELRRSQETAEIAGFTDLRIYPALNEEKGDLSDNEVRSALINRQPPEATRKAAQYLIEIAPEEEVWIMHGFVIAALCQELGVYTNERFVPRFGEIRKLYIPD